MCKDAHRRFTATSTPLPARQFVVTTITSALPLARANIVDDCELVIGELAVTDDAHGWPVLHPPNLTATAGEVYRSSLPWPPAGASRSPEDRRKTVWAHLSCTPLKTTTCNASSGNRPAGSLTDQDRLRYRSRIDGPSLKIRSMSDHGLRILSSEPIGITGVGHR